MPRILLQSEGSKGHKTRANTSTDLDGGTLEGGDGSAGGGLGSRGRHGARGGGAVGQSSGVHDTGESGVGNSRLHLGRVGSAGGVGGKRAVIGLADGLELSTLGRDDSGRGSATDVEDGVQGGSDNSDIVLGDTERGCCKANVLDEVTDLGGVKVHEAVDGCLGTETRVGREASGGAAKEGTEVLVQVGKELAVRLLVIERKDGFGTRLDVLLVGVGTCGRHVLEKRSSSSVIKEVDGNTGATTTVGRGKSTVEVGEEVDLSAVVRTLGKDTRNGDADIGLGVVSNDNGVDKESEKSELVGTSVVHKKSSSIIVTDAHVSRSLRKGRDSGRKTSKDGRGTHSDKDGLLLKSTSVSGCKRA